jgi:hypothetical protein
MKIIQRIIMILLSIVLLTGTSSLSYAIDVQQIQIPTDVKKDLQKPIGTSIQLCYDLDPQLVINKEISSGNGVFNLKGKVCNIGPGNFIVPPSAETMAVYYVYKRYPPKTYAQTGIDPKIFYSQKIKNLKKGECMDVNTTYTIPGVIQWGSSPSLSNARQAALEFTLRAENTKNIKDCNVQNDAETPPEILYMEKN